MESPIPPSEPTPAPARGGVRPFVAGLLLVLVALALTFNYVLVTDSTKLSGLYDVHRYFGPLAFYMDTCIHSGDFPLWNPVTYCGMPYAANPQVAALYPPNLLRSALTFAPTPYRTQFGLAALMGLHLLLAFGGTWLLARAHRISRSGAWTAALAFTFSALMVRRVCEYHFVYTLNWLPLLLFLAKQLLDAPGWGGRLRWGVAGGLVFGMATLGGFFQIVNYMGVTLAAYALLYRLLRPAGGSRRDARGTDEGRRDACGTGAGRRGGREIHPPALRATPLEGGTKTGRVAMDEEQGRRDACGTGLLRAWGRDGVALALLAGVALCVAAPLLLPAMELAHYTGRQPGVSVPMYSDLYKRLWLGIAQDAVVYPGMKYDAEALRGSGVAALTLALAALFTARRREVLLFAGVYLVLLDCSFGPPLPVSRLVNALTPFAPSAYSRAYDLALLPLSLLAGLGVDGLRRVPRRWWAALLETLLLTVLGGTLVLALRTWLEPRHYLGVSPWVAAVPATAVLVMLAVRVFPRMGGAAALLPLLVFLETLCWNAAYVPMMTRQRIAPIPPQTASMPQDNHRQTDAKANRELFRMRHLTNGYDPLNLRATWEALVDPVLAKKYSRLARQDSMAENQRTNLLFKRTFWLARQWAKGPLPEKSRLFPAATTVFLPDVTELPLPRVEPGTLGSGGISEQAQAVPVMTPALAVPVRAGAKVRRELRLTLPEAVAGRPAGPAGAVHSVLRLAYRSSGTGTVEVMLRDEEHGQSDPGKRIVFSPTAQATVEIPLPDCPALKVDLTVQVAGGGLFEITAADLVSDGADEDGLIKIVSRRANGVDLDVGPLDGSRVLVCLDAWYPGWHARIDGVETALLRADDGFKAVTVPPGPHRVSLFYRPARLYWGAALSVAALLLACGILWRARAGD